MSLFSPGGGGKVGTGFVPIKPDTEGFGDALEKGIDAEGGPAAERSGGKMAKVAKAAFLGGMALIGKAVFDFSGFEKQMNEVFTLLPGISGEAMGAMTEQVKSFATEFGVLPLEVVPALYQSLSAGVPKDNVFAFLETAQKLAKGGVTDLTTAVDGLSSVVNAYGPDVLSAQQASDMMFTTVKLGKTTIDELSSSLFQVTPTASALGIKFGDVSAAMAALTLQGVPTSVAATQLRQTFVELSKDGGKAAATFAETAGQSFKDYLASGHSLQDALKIMQFAAGTTGKSVSDLFGSVEAGSAALALTGAGADAFSAGLTGMGDSAGATQEAFDTMNKGLGATMDKLKAKFSVVLLNIGEAIAPFVGVVGGAVGDLLELFSKIPGPMQAIVVVLATVTAGLFAFAGPILKGITLFSKLGGVFSALAANPWIIVLAGLVAITILIIRNWETVKTTLGRIWAGLQFEAQALATFIVGIFTSVTDTVGAVFSAMGSTVSSVFSGIVSFITGIPGAISDAFATLASVISAPFTAAFGAIKAGWNSTVGGFGFTTPSWIPFVGGKSFTIPSMATGGVLTGPTLALAGEYPGAARNPEIVTPQNIMRSTMIDAIRATPPRGSSGGVTITGNTFHIREEADVEKVARALDRRRHREDRAQGRPQVNR